MERAADNPAKPQGLTLKSKTREFIESILWALVLALLIRTCVVQSCKIPSGSMEDTLIIGDCLLVNKFLYGIRIPFTDLRLPALSEPQRGEVIVFKYPEDRSKEFIKRLIGLPGDEIQIKDKQVYVNGSPYQNPHAVHKDPQLLPPGTRVRDNFGPIRVPENSFFMMGDNRDNSYDSRFWGFVPRADLVGPAFIKYWSWDQANWRVRWQRLGRTID